MMIMSKTFCMKPFNLEKAKQGAKVITREGRKVEILTFSRRHPYFPIVALVDEGDEDVIHMYTNEGRYYKTDTDSYLDLMMAPTKVYMNVYRIGKIYELGTSTFPTREKAIDCRGSNYVKTIEIDE